MPPLVTSPVSSMRSIASGIEAAEVLPVSTMSRATGTWSGSLSVFTIASMMRMLAWCGMKASRSSAVTPAAVEACWRHRRHLPDGPAEDLLALHASGSGTSTVVVAYVDPASALGDRVVLRAVGAPDVGPMPGSSDGPITTAPAPSPKMNAVERS